ncbi:hypothetical protein [Streptomyces sp. NPDC127039]|uniref:hypothetical protein n=1 Tax=Streptomyces sp. NPDC127039 TaxID=3347115 RepID=UPI00365B7CBE
MAGAPGLAASGGVAAARAAARSLVGALREDLPVREAAVTGVDGWGPLLGDDGGGARIGTAGLRAALRAHDGRGPDTVLLDAAAGLFGDLERLPTTVGRDGSPGLPVRLTSALGDPLEGARLPALDRATPHSSLVVRVRRTAANPPLPAPATPPASV